MDFKVLFKKKKTDDNNVYVNARLAKHDGGRKQAPEEIRRPIKTTL